MTLTSSSVKNYPLSFELVSELPNQEFAYWPRGRRHDFLNNYEQGPREIVGEPQPLSLSNQSKQLFCRLLLFTLELMRFVRYSKCFQWNPSRPLRPLHPESIAVDPFDNTLNGFPVQQSDLDRVTLLWKRQDEEP